MLGQMFLYRRSLYLGGSAKRERILPLLLPLLPLRLMLLCLILGRFAGLPVS